MYLENATSRQQAYQPYKVDVAYLQLKYPLHCLLSIIDHKVVYSLMLESQDATAPIQQSAEWEPAKQIAGQSPRSPFFVLYFSPWLALLALALSVLGASEW